MHVQYTYMHLYVYLYVCMYVIIMIVFAITGVFRRQYRNGPLAHSGCPRAQAFSTGPLRPGSRKTPAQGGALSGDTGRRLLHQRD